MHLGVDTHKRTQVVVALDEHGHHLGTRTVPNTPEGRAAALTWARDQQQWRRLASRSPRARSGNVRGVSRASRYFVDFGEMARIGDTEAGIVAVRTWGLRRPPSPPAASSSEVHKVPLAVVCC